MQYVYRRFLRKASLALELPKQPIQSCLLGKDGLADGAVPFVVERGDFPLEADDVQQLECLCLDVHNHGWDQSAVNCRATATIRGDRGQVIPVTAYWATNSPSDADYVTIPHRSFRRLILCLVCEETAESIFCAWASLKPAISTSPSWQVRPIFYSLRGC